MKIDRRTLLFAPLPLLAACTSKKETSGASDNGGAKPAAGLQMKDAWVKASDSGMTGLFGTLVNGTSTKITVTGASTSAAKYCELHEVVTEGGVSKMRQVEGGFPIEAGKERPLAPGSDHIMLMKMTGPLKPGDTVKMSLEVEGAEPISFEAVVKDFAGAKEKYDDMEGHKGHGGSDGGH